MATTPKSISGLTSAAAARVVLWQSREFVTVPGNAMGLLPTSSVSAFMLTLLDDADAAAAQATLGISLTPWVTYTPTFTGFGTPSGVSMWSRRLGDTLHIRGYFTSGTATAVEARMTLGFNGTNGGITSDATTVSGLQLSGNLVSTLVTGTISFVTLIESNVGYITFGFGNASLGALAKRNGNSVAVSGDVLSLTAEIPIDGW